MRRIQILLTLLLFMLLSAALWAQEQSLSGSVHTTLSEPMPYATVAIRSLDSLYSNGTYTDEAGHFSLQVPQDGQYLLTISSVGFTTMSQQVSIPTRERLRFVLEEDAQLLGEVTVVGRKKLIAIEPSGAISYNMAKDIASHTEDLLTAMRRVPMVVVDGHGNMQVKGSGNFSIYLNGKPFRSATIDPSQVLASIPASSVTKVEVITNPDASYEAESGSTVINIITDGKKIDGYNLRISAEGNSLPEAIGGISFNILKGGLKVTSSYTYKRLHIAKQHSQISRSITLPDGRHSDLTKDAIADGVQDIHMGRIMAEYEFDSIRTLYADAHVNYMKEDCQPDIRQRFAMPGLLDTANMHNSQNYNQGAFESNLLYRRQHRETKRELFSLGYRFSYSPDNRYQDYSIEGTSGQRYIKSLTNGGLSEHTFSMDAMLWDKNNLTIKSGLLDVLRLANSRPHYYTKPTADAAWTEISKEGHGDLKQLFNAVGGYLNGSYRWGRTSLNAGARLEYVSSQINQAGGATPIQERYFNFVPRLSVTTSPTNTSQLSLSYYYGVTRPSIWVMNPYTNQVNDYETSYGNPDLKYSQGHNVSLDAIAYSDKLFTNLSAGYSYTKDPINNYSWIMPDNPKTLFSSYLNGHSTQQISLSTMVNYRPTGWLSFNLYGNTGWYFFRDHTDAMRRAFSYNITTSCDITLPRNYLIGLQYYYTHMPPTAQADYGHDHFYSFYVTKKLWDGLMEVSLVAREPFRNYGYFTATTQGAGFRMHQWNQIKAQAIGVKLTLNFRSGKSGEVERDRSLQQSDLDHSTGVQ